jgi:prepilin-type processing-associated H-X9-DG protein
MKPLKIRGMMKLVAGLGLFFGVVAFLLDRVRWAREGARRAQCVSNLKQIGVAIHIYQEKNGCFPIGTIANPDLPLERRLGWNYLTPSCYANYAPLTPGELRLAVDDPALLPIRSDPPGLVLCPTLQNKDSANYVGIAGLGPDSPSLPKNHPRAGFFGDDRVVSSADLLDGSANTMMIVESSRPAGPWFAGGRATVRGLDPAHQPYIGIGRQFGGIHPGGVNVLMADGSIHFVKDSVDPKVFEAMSTIAGGEKVSVP